MAYGFALILGCAARVYAPAELAPTGLPPAEPAATPARARYQYLVAQLALAQGDTAAANAALETARLHDRDSPWLWLALAELARAQGAQPLVERARVAEAVRLGPELSETWTALGEVSARLGDRAAAEAAWRRATELGAGSSAWDPLIRSELEAGDTSAATTSVAAWSALPETDRGWLRERGRARLQVGDLAGAVDDLAEALRDTPDDARLVDEFVAAVTGSRRYRKGLETLGLLTRLRLSDTDLLLRTVHLAQRAEDPVRARDALVSLDRLLGGRDAQIKLWIAEAATTLRDGPAAFAALDAAAECQPPAQDLSLHRAKALRAFGRPREALAQLRVPDSGPNRVDAQALRVRLLVEVGRAADARAEAEAALSARPDDYALLGALVAACAALDDRAAMLDAVDHMAGLGPEARARTRARSLAGVGDLDGALEALRATPMTEAETWILGGSLLRDAGRLPESVSWMERATDRFPTDARVRSSLGLALGAAGAGSDALIAMREALSLDPTEPDAARVYARVLARPGTPTDRLTQADGFVRAALEGHPADPGLLVALGDVQATLGRPAVAAAVWEEARRYAPADVELTRKLAAVWNELGRTADADRLLRGLERR